MIVTTISVDLYKKYGENTLNTWKKNVGDHDVLLVCLAEEIEYFSSELPEFKCLTFRESDLKLVTHLRHREEKLRPTDHFSFSASRFFWKVAATNIAWRYASSYGYRSLIWLDADILMKIGARDFLAEYLERFDYSISYFGRWEKGTYPETGLIHFNLRDSESMNVIENWYAFYLSDRLFENPIWHDAYLFGLLMKDSGGRFLDISAEYNLRSSNPVFELGNNKALSHMKGGRKSRSKLMSACVDSVRVFFKR